MYGPLHNEGAVRKFEEAVKAAQAEGGKVEYGGKVRGDQCRSMVDIDSCSKVITGGFVVLVFSV